MSRTGGRDVAVAMRDCGISTMSQNTFVHIASLRSRSIKNRQRKHKLDYYGVVFAHLATGCGINAKDPSGLDSDRWTQHSRCCENPARAKALAGFSRHLSGGFTDLNPVPQSLGVFYRILCGYVIRSGRHPEGSQLPLGRPRPLTSRIESPPYRVTTKYSFYPVQT